MVRNIKYISLFIAGWAISPFNWWCDSFVNLPFSYLIAKVVFFVTRLPFGKLVFLFYWITSLLGIFIMYFYGKKIIQQSKNTSKIALFLVLLILVNSFIMFYLDSRGFFTPIGTFFAKQCVLFSL